MAGAQPADPAFMRELNERIVLNLIRQEGPISRAELARKSNLSRSTISSIITALLTADIVHETGTGDSRGGRRPIMIEFNYQSSFAVGVELGTLALTVVVTDLAGTILGHERRPFDISAGPERCLAQAIALIGETVQAAGITAHKIIGVGVGVPGPLDFATGRLIAPPVMPGWHDIPLRALLEDALQLRVFVENDANLGAIAEHQRGAAQGRRNVVYVYFGGDGIGAGLILDGRLYRGEIGSAGEIGHLLIDPNGPPCHCGAVGCLETVAGPARLLERASLEGRPLATIAELIGRARNGDPTAAASLREAGKHLGIAIASILNLLNPGCIILGGEVLAAGDLLLDPLRAALHRHSLAIANKHVEVAAGTLGEDVVAIGAISIVVQHAFNMPSLMAKNGKGVVQNVVQ